MATDSQPMEPTGFIEPTAFIEPTRAAGKALLARGLTGPVTMLNLLRFREVADYRAFPALAPDQPISGNKAYARYKKHTLPFLTAAGGSLLYEGVGGPWLIGPTAGHWDLVLLVRHKSLESFMSFARDPGYLAGIGHRTAALSDSRLLPLTDRINP